MHAALFPGSFDPFHLGHLDIVEQVAARIDHLTVAAVGNPAKPALFSLARRAELIARSVAHLPNVVATWTEGLAVDLAAELGADCIVRAVGKELDAELQMAVANERIANIETVMVAPSPAVAHLASRHIRAAVAGGRAASLSNQVPPPVLSALMDLDRARWPAP